MAYSFIDSVQLFLWTARLDLAQESPLPPMMVRLSTNVFFSLSLGRRASDFEMGVLAANRIDRKILIDAVPGISPWNSPWNGLWGYS